MTTEQWYTAEGLRVGSISSFWQESGGQRVAGIVEKQEGLEKEPGARIYLLACPTHPSCLLFTETPGKSLFLLGSLGNKSSTGMFSELLGIQPTSQHPASS